MPTNVYGHNDNFHKINGHVIPAMITKFEEAILKEKQITLLGTGKPLREFIHADDLASAILFSLKLSKKITIFLIQICQCLMSVLKISSQLKSYRKSLVNIWSLKEKLILIKNHQMGHLKKILIFQK